MRSFAGRDILSLKEFERQEFFRVFEIAKQLEPIARNRKNSDLLKDKTLVTAFYQPSTRTRLAHEAAMHRLGGHVTGFADAKMTRAGDFYQESIKDTVKMLEFYGDVIVMRHFQQGAPHEAAKWASVPIINGGDGWGEHPTQILTDLYTVLQEKGRDPGVVGRNRRSGALQLAAKRGVPRGCVFVNHQHPARCHHFGQHALIAVDQHLLSDQILEVLFAFDFPEVGPHRGA